MTDTPLRVDWQTACAAGDWAAALERARGAAAAFRSEQARGEHAFVDVALATDDLVALQDWCAAVRERYDDVLLAGIGGSALSARVFDALRDDPAHPRVSVLDTVDPHAVTRAMRCDPRRTLLVGVSKSGGTLETSAVFLTLEAWLQQELGDELAAHVAVVCGEEENALRAHARDRAYATFPVPAGVGGRYSGLSAAGLLTAALGGVSIGDLRAGAAWVWSQAAADDPETNPALALTALHDAARSAGRSVAVLMPYGERLRALAPWWAQLVGESLGKDGQGIEPVAARGPADQHSLLQLWLEGPDSRLVVLVGSADGDTALRVPSAAEAFAAAGHGLSSILDAERGATRDALAARARPVAQVSLAAADARSVGAFLMAYELAVVWLAKGMGVNPYGQPAVESGKQAALRRLEGGN